MKVFDEQIRDMVFDILEEGSDSQVVSSLRRRIKYVRKLMSLQESWLFIRSLRDDECTYDLSPSMRRLVDVEHYCSAPPSVFPKILDEDKTDRWCAETRRI